MHYADDEDSELNEELGREFVQRVVILLEDITKWCNGRDLDVKHFSRTLNEQVAGKYEAPGLHISKQRVPVAEVIPIAACAIGADGRVDLSGRRYSHALMFHGGDGPEYTPCTIENGRIVRGARRPFAYGADRSGWYWTGPTMWRPKRLDEVLFFDLLTDVSTYDL
ncbi:hypothetical protein [Cupriavidus plantarum]|uniref:hypothetical protein n=1 Tax=Cupriavidus plantarum TaxID=942865 RepID=UPI0015CC1024|nr:hypothetical protein [Cupriavidus plantarum]NYI02444.1 hypothetical protein [Cupriavidus plantarum]